MMKKVYISKHSLQLCFGILLSALVLVQSVHVTSYSEDLAEQTDQNESESDKKDTDVIYQSQAITNTSQISLGFDSYLLDEVEFKEVKDEKNISSYLFVPSVHKALRVLLRKIISPNAP